MRVFDDDVDKARLELDRRASTDDAVLQEMITKLAEVWVLGDRLAARLDLVDQTAEQGWVVRESQERLKEAMKNAYHSGTLLSLARHSLGFIGLKGI